ncbi:MAG TPA: PEPxxWA-CTERM sorting domain-containing protein [Sphingomonas sp.]|nr:PEPxxWA-CTERM sorting domain-containing protein [Sphingomonas sp.]
MRIKTLFGACLMTAAVAIGGAGGAIAATSNVTFEYTGGNPDAFATLLIDGGTLLTATSRGWIDATGGNNGGGTEGNYIAGFCGSSDACNGANREYHNYFTFDLSAITSATSAVLSLYQPDDAFGIVGFDGYVSPNPSITYALFDYTLSLPIEAASGTGAYDDLANGLSFGSVVVTAASNGSAVSFDLNSDGLAALNASAGGLFAFGGAVLDAGPPSVPEPASWAMMVGGFGLIGGAMRTRQKAAVSFG